MQLFFGFAGLYNLLLFWVLGGMHHISGIETFELPTTRAEIGANPSECEPFTSYLFLHVAHLELL